jgi:hypothetical protein
VDPGHDHEQHPDGKAHEGPALLDKGGADRGWARPRYSAVSVPVMFGCTSHQNV